MLQHELDAVHFSKNYFGFKLIISLFDCLVNYCNLILSAFYGRIDVKNTNNLVDSLKSILLFSI